MKLILEEGLLNLYPDDPNNYLLGINDNNTKELRFKYASVPEGTTLEQCTQLYKEVSSETLEEETPILEEVVVKKRTYTKRTT